MVKRSSIRKRKSHSAPDKSFAWTRLTRSESGKKQKHGAETPCFLIGLIVENLCGCRGLKQRNDRHALHVGCGNAFEMRPNAAQFCVHKRIHEVQVAIEPREHSVLDP